MGEFPNKLQQWEKGKSGNPGGRPKGSKNRSTIVRKWLNAFANKFFKKDHDYKYKGKIHIKLKNTYFKMNNEPGVLVQWFKNLKKLKQHHFEGEVFNAQLYKEQFKEAA